MNTGNWDDLHTKWRQQNKISLYIKTKSKENKTAHKTKELAIWIRSDIRCTGRESMSDDATNNCHIARDKTWKVSNSMGYPSVETWNIYTKYILSHLWDIIKSKPCRTARSGILRHPRVRFNRSLRGSSELEKYYILPKCVWEFPILHEKSGCLILVLTLS